MAQLNALDLGVGGVLSGGNLTFTYPTVINSLHCGVLGDTPLPATGKWYWEVTIDVKFSGVDELVYGVAEPSDWMNGRAGRGPATLDSGAEYFVFTTANGNKYKKGVTTGFWFGETQNQGETLAIAVDMDAAKIFFGNASKAFWMGDPIAGTGEAWDQLTQARALFPVFSIDSGTAGKQLTANFGASAFVGTVPTGYTALDNQPAINYSGFVTMSPVGVVPEIEFSRNNTQVALTGASVTPSPTVIKAGGELSAGNKYYFEIYAQQPFNATTDKIRLGVVDDTHSQILELATDGANNAWCVGQPGSGTNIIKQESGQSAIVLGGTQLLINGDTLMMAVDYDNNSVWFGENGTWFEGDPATNTGASFSNLSGTLIPAFSYGTGVFGNAFNINTGQWEWRYEPPTGFTDVMTVAAGGNGTLLIPFEINGTGGIPLVKTLPGATQGLEFPFEMEGAGRLPLNGSGDMPFGFEIVGSGKVPAVHADGILTIPFEIEATGASAAARIGNGDISIPFLIAGGQIPPNVDEGGRFTEAYDFIVTGAHVGLADVSIPFKSFQMTLNASRDSFVSCVVPHYEDYIDPLSDRIGGNMIITRSRTIGGSTETVTLAEVAMGQILANVGPENQTITVNGNGQLTLPTQPRQFTVDNARYFSTDSENNTSSIRLAPNNEVNPLDSITFGQLAFVIQRISWSVPESGVSSMTVSSG